MKKHITPENFLLIQTLLLSWLNVFMLYNLRLPAIILMVFMTLLIGFCIGFLWVESSREVRRLKQSLAQKKH